MNLSISIHERSSRIKSLGTINSRTVKHCGLDLVGGGVRVLSTSISHLYGSWSILAVDSSKSSCGGPRIVVIPPAGVFEFGS